VRKPRICTARMGATWPPRANHGAAGARSILTHHDLKIVDTSHPGPNGQGTVLAGCDTHSLIHRKGKPNDVIHREHNAFGPENGAYGSHMMYKEPGEYDLAERITLPDRSKATIQFPVWVPDPDGHSGHGPTAPTYVGGGVVLVIVLCAAYLLRCPNGRRAAASSVVATLTLAIAPHRAARAQEGEGHLLGADRWHLAAAGRFGPLADLPQVAPGDAAFERARVPASRTATGTRRQTCASPRRGRARIARAPGSAETGRGRQRIQTEEHDLPPQLN